MGRALVGEVGRELWLYREVVCAVLTLSAHPGPGREAPESALILSQSLQFLKLQELSRLVDGLHVTSVLPAREWHLPSPSHLGPVPSCKKALGALFTLVVRNGIGSPVSRDRRF